MHDQGEQRSGGNYRDAPSEIICFAGRVIQLQANEARAGDESICPDAHSVPRASSEVVTGKRVTQNAKPDFVTRAKCHCRSRTHLQKA